MPNDKSQYPETTVVNPQTKYKEYIYDLNYKKVGYCKTIEPLIDSAIQSKLVLNINIGQISSFPYLPFSHAMLISNIYYSVTCF